MLLRRPVSTAYSLIRYDRHLGKSFLLEYSVGNKKSGFHRAGQKPAQNDLGGLFCFSRSCVAMAIWDTVHVW